MMMIVCGHHASLDSYCPISVIYKHILRKKNERIMRPEIMSEIDVCWQANESSLAC